MVGGEYGFSHLNPSRFNESGASLDDVDEHAGTIDVHTVNLYGLYGFSGKLNGIVKIPFVVWHQEAVHQDNHHRTETIRGQGDISAGIRMLFRNETFGPGQRLYAGAILIMPTGEGYNMNPFSANADSISHTHFALGAGHFSGSLDLEWWYRSEFPLVIGASAAYTFPLNVSSVGLKSGADIGLELHTISQRALFWRAHPYLRLQLRRELADHWDGAMAPNSGGTFVDIIAGFVFEVSESISSVLAIGLPVWRNLEGAQMDGLIVTLSLRKIVS
jgi:hypothetical protein